jgi:hypothetical protein
MPQTFCQILLGAAINKGIKRLYFEAFDADSGTKNEIEGISRD